MRMDVREGAEQLVYVEFDLENGHGALQLVEVTRSAIHSFWNEFEDQIEIDFVFLRGDQRCLYVHSSVGIANPITVGVVKRLELDNVWMADDSHDLKLSVLSEASIL